MENTLIQKLETDAQERSISGEVVGLKALFLSQKEQIEEALSSGWKRSEVWAILKENGNYPGTYSAFLKHCSKFISPAPKGHFNPQKKRQQKKDTPAPENPQNAPQTQASQKNQENQDTPRKGPYDSGDHNLPTFTRNLDEEISFL